MMSKQFYSYQPVECPPPIDRQPRVIICAAQVPFVSGGAEKHIESLHRELVKRDYRVEIVKLPFKWHPVRQIIKDALAWRMLDLTSSYGYPIDLIIGTRFPSYCVRHPRKIAWVLHQHRQAYDFLNTEYTDFSDLPDDDETRKILYEIDARSLKECRKIFANSKNVAGRMKRYLNIDSVPLYHPPPFAGQYSTEGYDDSVFTACRLEKNKRIDLLLKAIALTRFPIRAIIAGQGPLETELKRMAVEFGIDDRILFVGYVSDQTVIQHYASCGLVWYAPLDEDYGYVTLEAFLSGKPVITADDSGGVLEFVEDGETGYIGKSNPESMAAQLDRWYEHRGFAKDMGLKAKKKISTITWDSVIESLTEPIVTDIKRMIKKKREGHCDS
jgi:glycosyltransferase involved in cell wall biosynthesis